jgi:hypothetical protein
MAYSSLMNEIAMASPLPLFDLCLSMAEDLSDNGICCADPDDVATILSKVTEANINDVAWEIADLANLMN